MLRIDPNWSVVDLDPRTWRNIGRFFEPGQYIRASQPGEHALFVLHENGNLLRVVDTATGVRYDLLDKSKRLLDPKQLAQELFACGEWERVHIINKVHLANVARTAQSSHPDSLDHYYRQIYHLLWDDAAGYVSVPPKPNHWNNWTYQQIADFCGQLPAQSSLALGVFDKEANQLAIGLILKLENEAITTVTTFEALNFDNGDVKLANSFLEQLCQQLEQKIAPVGAVLLCDQPTFNAWLIATDKLAFLSEAAKTNQIYWRLSKAA